MEKPLGSHSHEAKKISNGQIILAFLIAALSIMFLALTVAYLFSSDQWTWEQYRFPKVFLVSTIVIFISSWTLIRAKKALTIDQTIVHKKWLNWTLGLGLLFLLLQVLGWRNLTNSGIYMNGTPDGSYLYIISGLHALHLVVGLLLLYLMYRNAASGLKNPIKELLNAANPKYKQRFGLLETYWHFVGFLWLYLVLFFLFNHL